MGKYVEWCNRSLIGSPYYYCLCLDEQSFHKELKRAGVSKDRWPDFLASKTANATAHFFEHSNGKLFAIVTFKLTKGVTIEQIYSLLVHEAVHLWQEIKISIGERSPSSEFEAYSIQAISQELMESYRKQTKKK